MTTPPASGTVGPTGAGSPPERKPADTPNLLRQAREASETGQSAAPAGSDGLSAKEEAQLGALLAKKAAADSGPTVELKVEEPHAELYFGGVGVGSDWTTVPAHLAPDIVSAAGDAGVTITQKES